MNNRVADALDGICEQAEDAGLYVVAERVGLKRAELEAGSLGAEAFAAWCEERAARMAPVGHSIPTELIGAAATARRLYLRAAGALRGRWCSVCGDPAEGEVFVDRRERYVGPEFACNRCAVAPMPVEART